MLQIAVVEPYEPDAHWISLLLKEIELPAQVITYATDAEALDAWERSRLAIDLIIVTDVLPMRTLQEFVDAAISLYPGIPIVSVGEPLQVSACPDEIIDRYTKPLSRDDLRTICCWTLNTDGKNARSAMPGHSTFSAEMVGLMPSTGAGSLPNVVHRGFAPGQGISPAGMTESHCRTACRQTDSVMLASVC